MKTKIKIVTHDGLFHADEVFAIALLLIILEAEAEIIRTRDKTIIEEAVKNPNTFVIDVGMDYNPLNLNFDHHQDPTLPASNILIMHFLQVLMDIPNIEKLAFMVGISDFDTNFENVNTKWEDLAGKNIVNLNQVITSYNRDIYNLEAQFNAFKSAINFAKEFIENNLYKIEQDKLSEEIYKNKEVLNDCVAIFDRFCTIWKEKDEFMYAIQPNPQGWALMSKNSDKYPLPTIEHKDLVFAHRGKFIAIFSSKEAALEVAANL